MSYWMLIKLLLLLLLLYNIDTMPNERGWVSLPRAYGATTHCSH